MDKEVLFRKQISYLVMDVDGTLTDGKIYMGNTGESFKAFCIKDGYGIVDMLIPAGITPVIITGRESVIVQRRAEELTIKEVYQGVSDKVGKLREVTDNFCEVAVIGDDLNDICVMTMVKEAGGLVGCPADAADGVKKVANYICKNDGGRGAVREFIEWILS